jgi:hypothetical protein
MDPKEFLQPGPRSKQPNTDHCARNAEHLPDLCSALAMHVPENQDFCGLRAQPRDRFVQPLMHFLAESGTRRDCWGLEAPSIIKEYRLATSRPQNIQGLVHRSPV